MATIPQPRASGAATTYPPKRILVPMDLSEASQTAWLHARALAERFGARCEALYVQTWIFSVAGMGIVEPYMASEAARSATAELRKRLGPDAVVRGEIGSVEGSILADARGFDLIVAGSHGKHGVERALRGSIAEQLLRDSDKPVLVARGPASPIRRVLAPVNFEPHSWAAFEAAALVAHAHGAELTALHVVDQGLYRDANVDGPRRLLEDRIDALGTGSLPEALIEYGSPVERIASAAKDFDLVVVGAHRRGLLADAFGTTAERVLRHCPVPVLAIPSK